MADASYAQTDFSGGEISKFVQGRLESPSYRKSLNVCLNALPTDTGQWVRRPGFQFAQTTRNGLTAKLSKFDFQQNAPYNMEFTDGFMRFFTGPSLVMSNDSQIIVSISAANPAKVATTTAHGWTSGNQFMFSGLGSTCAPLQNRQFVGTVTSATELTLTDPITGATIDGATLTDFVSGTISRILEIATPYLTGSWSTLRAVQAERSSILLQGAFKPRVLVATPPLGTAFATFALSASDFLDGPYNDPIPTSIVTSSGLTGNVSLTFSFVAYDATVSYAIGDFVTSVGIGYQSLTAANQNHLPAANPTNWQVVLGGAAVGPNGFVATDIGRSVRLLSEPSPWDPAATYSLNQVVAFNGTYWNATGVIGAGIQPGVSLLWAVAPAAARWTWGQITAISATGLINPALPGSLNIGNLLGGGGVNAAFDGVTSKTSTTAASQQLSFSPSPTTFDRFVGKNYSGASAQIIDSATVFGSTDIGLAFGTYFDGHSTIANSPTSITVNLRAKHTAPATGGDGILIGTTGPIGNTSGSVTIQSTDKVTAWEYVWIDIVMVYSYPAGRTLDSSTSIAQVQFYTPNVANGSVVSFQIRGPALLYANAIRIWRLGTYSDTSGWPTCGTYHEGRLWLSGAVDNRVDSSKSNDLFNFAPTNPDGSVSNANAITYVFNSPDVNPIFWLEPDLQGILCGSQPGEWLLHPPTAGAMAPTNIAAQRMTKIGCANIEPKRTDHTTVFVQNFQRGMMEYFADVFSGKFSAPDLSSNARHLTKGYINEIMYQQETIPVLWSRVNGALNGTTYRRDSLVSSQGPNVMGWHRHVFATGDFIESIVVGPSQDGRLDALSIVSYNPANGIRHVGVLNNFAEEGDALAAAWYLDDAIKPSSTVINAPAAQTPYGSMTLNGLWHLNGLTVQIFAAGLDLGQRAPGASTYTDFVVSGGSTTVPFGDSISAGPGAGLFTQDFATAAAAAGQIIVGRTYTSQGQIVRPNEPKETGARTGPAFGKKRVTPKYAIMVEGTCAGLQIGTTFAKLDPILFKNDAGVALLPGQTFSGIYVATLQDDLSFDSMICWQQSRPVPANVLAIGPVVIQTHDG